MLSSFISKLRKQSSAFQTIVATIPILIYFRDEYYSITCVRGTSMEPTIQQGDIVLIRKRDAGSVLLNILYSIGYLESSSSSSSSTSLGMSNTPVNVEEKEHKTSTISTNRQSDDDRLQALRYRLENNTDSSSSSTNTYFWLISPSYLSPLILPGHVVLYQNPFRFQESVMKRVVGVGGQRVATRTAKTIANENIVHLPNDVINTPMLLEGKATSELTTTQKDDAISVSSSSDYPTLLQHLRRKQQQKVKTDGYYDVRLPPHYIYTEDGNCTASATDDSYYISRNQPISQNVMIGIAEYIIWPPSRFQRIVRQPVYETINNHNNTYSLSRPRAIWD